MKMINGTMRCCSVFACLLAFCSGALAGLNDGLVAYYPFDGNANDAGPFRNHGVNGGATFTANGKVGGAIHFNGMNQYVRVRRSLSLEITGPISMCAWVRPEATGLWMAVVEKEINFTGYNLNVNNGRLYTRIDGSTLDSVPVPLGQWTHLIGVFTGSQLTQYLNGQEVGRVLASSLHIVDKDLSIGAWYSWYSPPGSYTRFFKGDIDEVRIYNRALSTNEIQQLYLLGMAKPVITTQPQSQTAPVGSSVSFSLTATGVGTLNYQWRFNGALLVGKTNSALTINAVQLRNAGVYVAEVKNAVGSTFSVPATLKVLAQPATGVQLPISRRQ